MTETRSQTHDDSDDWSQISNKVMRKRVQNRIAQRNYRKGIKARLNELERLATREASPATTTNNSQHNTTTPARDSASSTKDQPASSRAEMPDISSTEVMMPGAGFPLDGSPANYMYHHPASTYPAVSGSLTMAPAMPVHFPNTFSVPEWGADGRLSPTTNLLAHQGYVHPHGMAGEPHAHGYPALTSDMDSLGRQMEQHRQAMGCHDMQSYAKSTSSGASSDQLCPSTDSTAIQDAMISSSCAPSHDSQSSLSNVSTRTSVSKHSNGPPSWTSSKDRASDESATLSSRIASAMTTIRGLGFSGIEELTAQFYTADLQDRPSLADAQRISRRRGLTRILAKLREHAKDDWTEWEAQGYREEIVRAAEDILGDECRRFSEEDDTRSKRRSRNVAELKQQFQEELPNLYGLLGVLSLSSQQWDDADHSTVIVSAISSILRDSEGLR